MINKYRELEIEALEKKTNNQAIAMFIWNCTPFFISVVSFSLYLLIKPTNHLDVVKAFASLSLIDIIKQVFSIGYNKAYTSFLKSISSVRGIEDFLLKEELNDSYKKNFLTGKLII